MNVHPIPEAFHHPAYGQPVYLGKTEAEEVADSRGVILILLGVFCIGAVLVSSWL